MSIGTRPLDDNEISLILNNLNSPRDKFLFLIGLKTGFRISELLSVTIEDLKETNGTLKSFLTVKKSKMKGKVASRSVPLSKSILEAMEGYLNNLPLNQKYLFVSKMGNKLSRIQAWRIIKQAAIKAELTGKIATHSSRKSFAKKVYESSGKDLVRTQKALGHLSINSTVSYLNSFNNQEIDDLILKSQD